MFRNGCQGMGHTFVPMLSGVLEVSLRVVKVANPYLAFRGVALARSICLDRRLDHVDDHLLDLAGKNGFFSVSLRRTSYLGAKLSIEI